MKYLLMMNHTPADGMPDEHWSPEDVQAGWKHMEQIWHELTEAGFSIAIDDFGTGYSSLSRLRHMPVRVLKIDRSFVSNVQEDRQAASIVTAFLELASGLDLIALAEGIETPEELAFLRERGCKLGQGYYFSSRCRPRRSSPTHSAGSRRRSPWVGPSRRPPRVPDPRSTRDRSRPRSAAAPVWPSPPSA